MGKIQNISAETKAAIRRKSAHSLPNNPTDAGMKADDIRRAFWEPVIDAAYSALAEVDRVINEVNSYIAYTITDMDSIESVAGIYYHSTTGLIYTMSDGFFAVSGYEGEDDSVIIPRLVYYEGNYIQVRQILDEAFKGKAIKSVEIPDTVTTIGDSAFNSCMSLMDVTFKGATTLGSSIFSTSSTIFTVPKEYISDYKTALASYILNENQVVGVDTIANNAKEISDLIKNKLDKVATMVGYERVYAISETGAQTTKRLTNSPVAGEIPVFSTNGNLQSYSPVASNDVTPKSYVENRLEAMGAKISFTIDPTTYKMTLQLKNESGAVLSSGVVDLPLESMILGANYSDGVLTLNIKTADGSMDNAEINVNISDLISGLVSEATFDGEVDRLDERIDDANIEHDALAAEVEQKAIYSYSSFHAEEADTARRYTKGGAIDKRFKVVEAQAATNILVSLDSDYKLTITLLNKGGEAIDSKMVDLPIESLITRASYSNKVLKLTFQSGDVLNVDISDMITGLVQETRKINGHTLENDVQLNADDVGAYAKADTYTKSEVSNLLSSQSQTIMVAIEDHQVVGFAAMCDEAEKARGYIKGGTIDKAIQKLNERVAALEENTGGN